MKSQALLRLEKDYQKWRQKLAQVGYLSKGSVFQRPAGKSGSRYQWSTKVKARTVSLTLSEEQYYWLKVAIQNQRNTEKVLSQMHRMSRQIMRLSFPDTNRRKRLHPKVLRLI